MTEQKEKNQMQNSDLLGILRTDPSKLSDHELLFLDYTAHYAWQHQDDDSKPYFPACTPDHLIELHALIRRQMENRGFRHLISDSLDARTSLLEQQRRTIDVGFFRGPLYSDLPALGDIDAEEFE